MLQFDLSCLSSAHPDSVNMCSLKNQTALLLAASRGHVSCVDFLLKHGAELDIANKDRDTPLFTGDITDPLERCNDVTIVKEKPGIKTVYRDRIIRLCY